MNKFDEAIEKIDRDAILAYMNPETIKVVDE